MPEAKDHIFSLTKVQRKMPVKPKMYKLYDYFIGINQLSVSELKEFKKVVSQSSQSLIKDIDKDIALLNKKKKAS